MTIYYFTSTGNCFEVAKEIGGRRISIPKAIRELNLTCEDESIGLVFPVFGLSVPPLILDFLKKVRWKADYLFAVLTYGTYDAGAVDQFRKAAMEAGLQFQYINTLHMQENYLPGFAMEKQKKPEQQDDKMLQIIKEINDKKVYMKHNSGMDRFMTWTHQKNYHYKRGIGVTSQYRITDNCSGCGTCERICPTQNITLTNGKPVFGEDCISCLSCTQNCPSNAIRLSSEKSKVRYRNSNVTLAELIDGNRV